MIMFKFFIYSANTHTCQILVEGWKKIAVSIGELYINDSIKIARYQFIRTGTISNTNAMTFSNVLPAPYRPKIPIRSLGHNSNAIKYVSVHSNGDVIMQSSITSSSSITIAVEFTFSYD